MRRAALLLTALLCAATACQPIGVMNVNPLRSEWIRTLYDLERFAFSPNEPGAPSYVLTKATPAEGMLVVPSRDRHIRALDATNGRELWRFKTRGPNSAPALVVGEHLIVGSIDGFLYRLYQRNGDVVWKTSFPGGTGITSKAVTDGKRVFATSIGNRVAAFDVKTGKMIWNRHRPHSGEFSITGQAGPLLDNKTVVTGFSDGWLVGFSVEDGATLWSTNLTGGKESFVDVDATPIIVGDTYVVSSYSTGLFAVERKSGEIRWVHKGEGFQQATLYGATLYVPRVDGVVFALNAKTGKTRWVRKVGGRLVSPLLATGRYLLVPNSDSLVVIDRKTGRTLSRVGDPNGFTALPTVARGVLFAQSNGGLMYALGIY
jgi:outer membrane protein assembly factor BamB